MSTLTISTIQADLRWEDKAANLAHLEEKIMSISDRTELVILPEMFSTGFSMRPELLAEPMDGQGFAWMKRVAAKKRVILTGSLIIEEGGAYYNRLIWMLPNGQYGTYDKRHRFGYAGEDEHYTAGDKRLIASVKGWRINLQVCYDLRFPVWARQQLRDAAAADAAPAPDLAATSDRAGIQPEARPDLQPEAQADLPPEARPDLRPEARPDLRPEAESDLPPEAQADLQPETQPDLQPEYDVLVYVANWPERRSHAWKTLLQARAIENQSFVIGVNRVGKDGNDIAHSGDSMIVDPLGTVLYHAGPQEEIFTYVLEKEKLDEVRGRFPFWKDGDHFSISR